MSQDVPIYPYPHCTFIISTAARLTSPSFLDLHPGCLEGHFTSDFIKNMSVSVCISLCVFISPRRTDMFFKNGDKWPGNKGISSANGTGIKLRWQEIPKTLWGGRKT